MGWRNTRPQVTGRDWQVTAVPRCSPTGAWEWRADRRWAIGCAGTLLAMACAVGWGVDALTPVHGALWSGAAFVILAVLWPPRVVAGGGWLAVRTLLRTRMVHTDALVRVDQVGDIAVSVVLRDAYGGRVEFAREALVANPVLWHALETGVRRSVERGTLRAGTQVLRAVGEHVDAEAEKILRASGVR